MPPTAHPLVQAAVERLREFGLEASAEQDASPQGHVDAVVVIARDGQEERYGAVVREPMTLGSLANDLPRPDELPLLVIGDRISTRSASALRRAGVQFVDGRGNASVAFGNVLIEVQGRAGASPKREMRPAPAQSHPTASNLFSPRRAQVLLALLTWPQLATRHIREVANTSGTSVGQAHDTLSHLERAGYLVPSVRRLERVDELLDYWAAAYPTGLGRRLSIANYHGDPTRVLATPKSEDRVYRSGESAAGADIASPATLTAYVDALDPKLPILNRWRSDPDRIPNIFIRRKFWNPLSEASPEAEHNAPWPLVYADLLAAGDARLAEVARVWKARHARSHPV